MNFSELLFFAMLALLVFGPRRLPEIARIVGKTMGELRRASNEFKNSLEEEIRSLDYQESVKKAQSSLPEAPRSASSSNFVEHSVATDPYAITAEEEAMESEAGEAVANPVEPEQDGGAAAPEAETAVPAAPHAPEAAAAAADPEERRG